MAQPQGQQRGQQGPPPLPDEEQIADMVSDLSKELSLTEAQESQVSNAYFTHFEELHKMIENSDSRPNREVMEQIKSDFETEVKSYLTKEQQKEFSAYQKKQQSKREQGKPRR